MLFLTVFLGLVVLVNRYLWMRLVRDTRLSKPGTWLASGVLFGLTASLPIAIALWAKWSRAFAPRVNFVAFSWLGVSFYLLMFLSLCDLIRLALWLRQRLASGITAAPARPDDHADHADHESRRTFIARGVASGALVVAGGIGGIGMRGALWDITTPETSIKLARLPRALDGFSIALLTDVHIGPLLDGRFLRHLVDETNRMHPDMVVIGGDLVDGSVAQLGHHVGELARLRSKHGVYFVTGNHEYYSGVGPWSEFLQRLGVRVLSNQMVSIGDAIASGASFDVAGVPDFLAGRAGAETPQIERAVAGRDAERELLVLAHQPVQIHDSLKVAAGLQLSGHTHGGQLYPFGALTRLVQPYLAGLYRHPESETQIYVSRGSGFWGPPMRVLAPAEIALLRLHA
jgi:predicted MPP superfamily phosphohydrolase